MDVIFNCPECDQELQVDSTAAGSEIACPNCEESIVIPGPEGAKRVVESEPAQQKPAEEGPQALPKADEVKPVNAIASSAAAKVEHHFKVPQREAKKESLIEKPLPPLDAAAKDTDKKLRVKTIKRGECVEVGHDRFDEIATAFLSKIGEENLINVSTVSYDHLDNATQKVQNDFGLLIVYRG
jgi:DNA-directed RNA polymerase subunit RPC12/RpoP